MLPIVDGLEKEFSGQFAIERRNANSAEGKATMVAYGLRVHPSYVVVAPDGKVLWTGLGAMKAEDLQPELLKRIRP